MREEFFIKWLDSLKEAWENLDSIKAANLFSKDVEYYESVLNPPIKSWEEVLNLWKVVPNNQKEVKFNYNIVSLNNDLAIINWNVKRVLIPSNQNQIIDGIFIIKLNNKGLCNYFKQWRTVK